MAGLCDYCCVGIQSNVSRVPKPGDGMRLNIGVRLLLLGLAC